MGTAGVTAWRLKVPAPSTTQYVISGGSSSLRHPHQPCLFNFAEKTSILEAVVVLEEPASLPLGLRVLSDLGSAENWA